jgi:hypothetical protein
VTRSRMVESIRRHPLLCAIQVCVLLVCVPAFMSAVSFVDAVTPQEAIAKYSQPLPSGWTAGVINHGHYYQWWTIQERPLLFAFSAFCLVAGVLFLWGSAAWLWRKRPGS